MYQRSKEGVLYGESNQSWLHEGDAADKGQFGLYYTCGLLIHQAIDQEIKKKSKGLKNIYSLWNEYRQKVEQGDEKGTDTFLALVEQYTSKALVLRIKELVETKLDNPEEILSRL